MEISVLGILSGFKNLILDKNKDKAEKRIAICKDCEFIKYNDTGKFYQCGKCGCVIEALVRQDYKVCQLGKWNADTNFEGIGEPKLTPVSNTLTNTVEDNTHYIIDNGNGTLTVPNRVWVKVDGIYKYIINSANPTKIIPKPENFGCANCDNKKEVLTNY